MNKEKNRCVLCHEVFEGWGNNPQPLKQVGRCCDLCNGTKVIPQRLFYMIQGEQKVKDSMKAMRKGCTE